MSDPKAIAQAARETSPHCQRDVTGAGAVARAETTACCPGSSDLSARALTEDAEGCSRLRAVIATDPGYEARAQQVLDRESGSARASFSRPNDSDKLTVLVDEAAPCASLTANATPVYSRMTTTLSSFAALASTVLALVFGTQTLSALTLALPAL